jgi:carnitine O-palmitoyltransferase 2
MNRNYFKKQKLSPDSMFQLAFQMAYFKVYKSTPPTYESCSTSAFKHGRTEVVRSATSDTKATCEAFAQKELYSPVELRSLLDGCSKKHMQLTKDAAMGQGFDRHLFALRTIAEKKGLEVPMFKDKSYLEANHFILSTSTLMGEYFSGGGFAPVVQDGFGLGYGYVDDTLGMLCSSYKGQRDGKALVAAFVQSLDEILEVLQQTTPK